MATTFKALVYADNKRRDGTYNVKIRVTHNRKSLKVSTNLYAVAGDLTRSLKIKNPMLINQSDALIRNWREAINKAGQSVNGLDVKEVVEYLRRVDREQGFHLDFIAFGRKIADRKGSSTKASYLAALQCLSRYAGETLDVSAITCGFLEGFETFILSENKKNRKNSRVENVKTVQTAILYLNKIRAIHNEAKRVYNDEDTGLIRITRSPFDRYDFPRAPRPRKRALSVETIQAIIDYPGGGSRAILARDCFLLSFTLAGMNGVDMYLCGPCDSAGGEKLITYNRQKTRGSRVDEAEMRIRVEPCIAPLVEKYKDPTGRRLFNFHTRYGSVRAFSIALNEGLTTIAEKIGVPRFTFYAGRHSYATISRSSLVNIDKYTVHEGLNHSDPAMRITDVYIDRDFRNVWNANAKLLALFDWSAIKNPLRL